MKKLFLFLFFLAFSFSLLQANEKESLKKRILVGSPVCQNPEILKEFLSSLDRLEKTSYTLDFCFVDDNKDSASKEILQKFSEDPLHQCLILSPEMSNQDPYYVLNEYTHIWTTDCIWKVANFKDRIIQHAIEKNYDYLFLIDSDLVLHSQTVEQLIAANKGIVCNIFWTSWLPDLPQLPQVWMQDDYQFYETLNKQALSQEEIQSKNNEFINRLRKPGTYEVGGLGACTLIDRATLLKGVSFKRIKNISLWGEDRHFCVRAAALGIPLFVDTHYPAFHIYRLSDLSKVPIFIETNRELSQETQKKPRITLSMVIRNESQRYLREVLMAAREYVTDAVIIDDASDDNSAEICKEVLQGIPLKLVVNETSKFSAECSLREQQWNETVQTSPEWILSIDADEVFEEKFKDKIQALLADQNVDAYFFRLYDFWNSNHYREDQYWSAHLYSRPFLVRYKPNEKYTFKQTAQHCGRFPIEVQNYSKTAYSDLRLKHFGWANEKHRLEKYERYNKLDPGAKYGWKEQYESILDVHPNLVEWKE